MLYSEAAYFDGAHVQHIADYYEVKRLAAIRKRNAVLARDFDRRRGSRARHAA